MVADNIDTVVILTIAEFCRIDPSYIHFSSPILVLLREGYRHRRDDYFMINDYIEEFTEQIRSTFQVGLISIEELIKIKTVGKLVDHISQRVSKLPPQAHEILSREAEIVEKYEGHLPRTLRFITINRFLRKLQSKLSKVSAITLIIALTTYYLIIIAHRTYIIKWLFSVVPTILPSIFAYLIAFILLITIPVIIKTSLIRMSKQVIFLYSIIFIFVLGTFLLIKKLKMQRIWLKIIYSNYMSSYHYFWIGIFCTLFYLYFFIKINNRGRISDFMDKFKAFPLLSPVFCFGAPPFWSNSLTALGISTRSIRLLGAISFFVGFIFLVAILLFYVSRHLKSEQHSSSLANQEQPTFKQVLMRRRFFSMDTLSLLLTMIGLSGITFVSLEIGFLILVNSL